MIRAIGNYVSYFYEAKWLDVQKLGIDYDK